MKPVYNYPLKLFFVLFLCIIDNAYSQSNLLVNESLNGSFSQGKMEGSINKFFTQDTYYLRSDFNVKILRLFNIEASVNERGHLHETIFFVVNWFIDQLNCLENKRIPKIFISGSAGAAFNRLMAFKVKENGGKVFLMDHGCGVGLWKNNYRGFFEFDWADSFITFGPEMAKGAKQNSLNKNRFYINKKNLNIFFINHVESQYEMY